MEIREFEVRADDEGVVRGIAVPYGDTISVSGYKERFERGSIDSIENVKLFYGHSEPIGKVLRGEDTDEGFLIEAKISDTARGNEIRTLLKDGVLNKFSVGFEAISDRQEEGVVVREKVRLREVSVVAFPAYDNASVLSVRQDDTANAETNNMEENNMSENDNIAPEVTELREQINLLERKVDSIEAPAIVTPECHYRSYGEYIKGYIKQEDKAVDLFRTYTGGTSDDAIVKDAWVGSVVEIINKPRKVLNAFSTATLPSEGLKVEYAKLDSDTVAYGEQENEGDVLDYGAISLTTATADVKTYGGYIQMSRQEIERASHVSVLQTAFEAMAARYGTVTNSVVRAAVVAATTQEVSFDSDDLDSTGHVLGLVYDAAAKLDTYNAGLENIIVSGDVFKTIATITDGANRPVMNFGTGSNTIGSASVAGITANIAGVPVIVDPGASAGTMWFVNSGAVKSFESPGAPLRLSDGDITNLTNVYSVYGYMAVAVQRPNLVVKVDFGAGS